MSIGKIELHINIYYLYLYQLMQTNVRTCDLYTAHFVFDESAVIEHDSWICTSFCIEHSSPLFTQIAPSLPTSNTPPPTHKPLTPTEGVGSPVEPEIKKISGDETSLEDKKEWESFPVIDDVPASSPRYVAGWADHNMCLCLATNLLTYTHP